LLSEFLSTTINLLANLFLQALASLSSSPQPVKNFEMFFNQQSSALNASMSNNSSSNGTISNKEHLDLISKSFNPLIYGNDVDSVDVATRITMVQFLNSKNILGNFNEHTRILRLYPRPVVAFQYNSFIRSRPIKSNFIIRLARAQVKIIILNCLFFLEVLNFMFRLFSIKAVEYFAEWSLCPNNVAYLRIQTGIFDPSLIGDKPKWYCRYLTPIQFRTYEEKSTLAAAIQFYTQENGKSKTAEEDSPTGKD
jgi:hypothetical protein